VRSSAVEHCLHTAGVTGSIPVAPTNQINDLASIQAVAFGSNEPDRRWFPIRACFDLANTEVLASPDSALAVVVTPWASTGFHRDGAPFDRPGRATIALARQPDGHWLGVHSHMSLQRGVPQESFGSRRVKAH
jgi:hypothetical protein